MPDSNQPSSLNRRVRVLQVVHVAMAMGVLAFLVVAFVLHTKIDAINKAHNLGIVTYIALAYGVAALIGGPLLAGALVDVGRRRLAAGLKTTRPTTGRASGFESDAADPVAMQLSSLLVSRALINAAIYEGAALFLGVAFLLNHSLLTGVCSAILAVALLMQMPTAARARHWVQDQFRRFEEESSSR